jgi:hypothetical protein
MKIYFYQNELSNAPKWPPLRQTFLASGVVRYGEEYEYVLDCEKSVDYLLAVADGQIPQCECDVPKHQRILLLMENPAIWVPPLDYLDFFGVVLSPLQIPVPKGVRLVISQPAVSWFYGLSFRTDCGLSHEPVLDGYMKLDDLAVMPIPEKKKLLSCVVSGKGTTDGHKWRIQTAVALKEYFGDEIDMYGFGWNPIADKREAIDPYLFTVVIENDSKDNYWTEKLSDAILGYAQPIYAGAPNVGSYFNHLFPTLKYCVSPEEFVAGVVHALNLSPIAVALYERRLQLMYQHNMFYHVAILNNDGII